jgi:F0F1-type ATP synthase membrane subunit b/b'
MSVQLVLEQEKQAAFGQLEKEVGALSQQILKKLLGSELAH